MQKQNGYSLEKNEFSQKQNGCLLEQNGCSLEQKKCSQEQKECSVERNRCSLKQNYGCFHWNRMDFHWYILSVHWNWTEYIYCTVHIRNSRFSQAENRHLAAIAFGQSKINNFFIFWVISPEFKFTSVKKYTYKGLVNFTSFKWIKININNSIFWVSMKLRIFFFPSWTIFKRRKNPHHIRLFFITY